MRNILIALALLVGSGSAFAQGSVDEHALKQNERPSTRAPLVPQDVGIYSGDTTAGVEWNRPFAAGTCCSGLGPVRFVTQDFSISADDTCDINSTQDAFDGYLFVYQAPFDPADQTANFVAGDDDGNGGIGTSDIESLGLSGNTTYTIVTTGFAAGDVGTFTNSVSCPTASVNIGAREVQIVGTPVPSISWQGMLLIAGLVLLSAGFVMRNRI